MRVLVGLQPHPLDAQVARDFNVKLGDIFTLNIYGKKIQVKKILELLTTVTCQ